MRIIGVTGGIGSGKSTVAALLNEMGAKVVDADYIAREIVSKGQKALEELTLIFGTGILDSVGSLDRRKMAEMVFGQPELLKKLNDITHKHITEKILQEVEKAKNEQVKTLVLDVPIPIKRGFLDTVDEVWVVLADKETRINRVMNRSELSREQVLDRMNVQNRDEEYLSIAHHVIWNDVNYIDLKSEVERLFTQGGEIDKEKL